MTPSSIYGIDRLDYRLKDFTRYAWVSQQAREKWEPRINQIIRCWQELEWRSILMGIRKCSLQIIEHDAVEKRQKELSAAGLDLVLLDKIAASQNYTTQFTTASNGEHFVYWSLIGNTPNIALFKKSWAIQDQKAIGHLLGYPACCVDFFHKTWVESGFIDTTWPMAFETSIKEINQERLIEVSGPYQSNILLRWLGPRLIYHLPCSFQCDATVKLASQFQHLALQLGYEEEMAWLQEMLSWPVEWSALHGIAEVKNPIVKLSTATDATSFKYTVRYKGDGYPEMGAIGLGFPHQQPKRLKFTETKSFNKGIENPIVSSSIEEFPWFHHDNGFNLRSAMDEAHQPLVDLSVEALQGQAGQILDLGCGNGLLLKKIAARNTQLIPFGIDGDPQRIEHAKILHPNYPHHFISGDMFESNLLTSLDTSFQLVILMLGRLLEVDNPKQNFLKSFLRKNAKNILVYAYDDYLNNNTLEDIARMTGFRLLTSNGNVGLATLSSGE